MWHKDEASGMYLYVFCCCYTTLRQTTPCVGPASYYGPWDPT